MAKDKTMSVREHFTTADDLAMATHHLKRVFERCQGHYYKTSRLMKLLYKVYPGVLSGIFTQIQSELDQEYHKTIDDKVFRKHGHIYYNLEKRYAKLNGTK